MPKVDFDSVCRCLANERRRTVIASLRDMEAETASLDDLVDHVVEQETNSPAPDRETVAIELYHRHLPMLADHGLVDFDERTKTVSHRTQPEIEQVVDAGLVP